MSMFMFDILVYVFENYLPGACPEPEALARKLSSIGFEDDAIVLALQWLAGLEQAQEESAFRQLPATASQRLYGVEEMESLPAECRGFLSYLETAGAIDAVAREMIVERAMAIDTADRPAMTLARFKVIVLMVMWRRELSLDNLVFEDLLEEADEDNPPLMH
jgi:Smg protein